MHHVSALSASANANHDFYTRVMGMRLVKKTVNQDEPSMYHLFYADARGTPGTDLTFFEMPQAARWTPGNNSIAMVTLRVSGEDALSYWMERLTEHGISHFGVANRDNRWVLDFDDPEGTPLSLVDDGGSGPAFPWSDSTVAEADQIRGLGYNVLNVPSLGPTERFLGDALSIERVRGYQNPDSPDQEVHVFAMANGGPETEIHVAVRRDLDRMRYGAGGVHHLALRIADEEAQQYWLGRLDELGYVNSGAVDRFYFKSIYVREPNGILFELATDGPGFGVDEDAASLGKELALPPFLEPRRHEIESKLHPVGAL